MDMMTAIEWCSSLLRSLASTYFIETDEGKRGGMKGDRESQEEANTSHGKCGPKIVVHAQLCVCVWMVHLGDKHLCLND